MPKEKSNAQTHKKIYIYHITHFNTKLCRGIIYTARENKDANSCTLLCKLNKLKISRLYSHRVADWFRKIHRPQRLNSLRHLQPTKPVRSVL